MAGAKGWGFQGLFSRTYDHDALQRPKARADRNDACTQCRMFRRISPPGAVVNMAHSNPIAGGPAAARPGHRIVLAPPLCGRGPRFGPCVEADGSLSGPTVLKQSSKQHNPDGREASSRYQD